jgi:ABC-2 type transport system ATP-binding protein
MELTIERLSKTYPNGVRALCDVSLTIGPGMYGLLGPNGAGQDDADAHAGDAAGP